MVDFDDMDGFDDLDDDGDMEAAIEKFERDVQKNMRIILRRKHGIEKRVEAARWLGESGAPKAISALAKVYRGDKDPKMEAATAYALGQFKALDNAITREPGEPVTDALLNDDNEQIYDLLTTITLDGVEVKGGGLAQKILSRFNLLLVVSLVLLIGINAMVFLSSEDGDGDILVALGTANTGNAELDTLADLHLMVDAIDADATTLQSQLSELTAEGIPVNCDVALNRPERYAVPPEVQSANFEIFTIANNINASLSTLDRGIESFDALCGNNTEANIPDQATIAALVTDLDELSESLPPLDEQITAIEDSIVPVVVDSTPEVEITEEVVDLEPTIVLTPTLDPARIIPHRTSLLAIINRVNEPSGALTLFNQVWEEVRQNGGTRACSQPPPFIPEDYTDLPQDIADEVPALADATNQINLIGLAFLRQGWDSFFQSCTNNTLTQDLARADLVLQSVNGAFVDAREAINTVR